MGDGQNIRVEGVILLDSPAWELHVRRCKDVTIRNVKIISWRENGDGIDYERDFYPAVMSALFDSNSWLAIVMITDLLARQYRFNVPGTKASLNWTRRIQRSITKLRSSRKEQSRMQLIRELLVNTGRI